MNAITPALTPSVCPHARAAAATEAAAACPVDAFEPTGTKRDLAPCHLGVVNPDPHPPVPAVGSWANAKHYDVVVVGAGMSGLHTAWRLRGLDGSAPPQGRTDAPTVAVFERTHHMGGRARSTRIEGAAIPLDLGAMRFIPSQHALVNGLAKHFNLATRDFVVGGDNNLQYLRGVRNTNADVARDPSLRPYHLAPDEQGKSVEELLARAIDAVVPGFREMNGGQLDQALRAATLPVTDPSTGKTDHVPLDKLGVRNVLERTLSHEAVALITDTLGYPNFLQNWDAGTVLAALAADFAPGIEYKTPVDGMKMFPKSLATDLRKNGTEIHNEQTLRQVDFDPATKQFRLTFEKADGTANPVTADQLVLAMPKKPLQAVVTDSPFLQRTPLEKNLEAVSANPMSRIFVAYDKPWWNEQGIKGGRSVTDLPLGQVYYYGSEGDKRPYVQIYADGPYSDYWHGLQAPGTPEAETGLCARPQLADELQRQLETMHGHPLPAPNGFLYKRWADPFTGGAYHTWKPGTHPHETSEAMIAPLDGVPLYVCGEAFSLTQAWMEGALQTSEQVLAKMGKTPSEIK